MNVNKPWAITSLHYPCKSHIALCAFLAAWNFYLAASAQVSTSITSTSGAGNLGTTITQTGSLYDITGGTRTGTNLFHSFGNFSVGVADTANFLNTPLNGSLPLTTNILGRVTNGNPSTILGTIKTTGFGNANLFLMNPAGIVFGPTSTLNVGGAVTFTTANYMRLADAASTNLGVFSADPIQASLLTSAPVTSFGFLDPSPGAITVQGSHLSVTTGQGISLVGGNIAIESGAVPGNSAQPTQLVAPGGQVNLVSVASQGEVQTPTFLPSSGMTMGNVALSQGTLLDVSAEAAGTIRIRGGQLVLADATLSADTGNTAGAQTAVAINISGDLTLADTRGIPTVTARATGAGDAGEVQIIAGNLSASSTFVDPLFLPTSVIDTHTTGMGRAGDVRIQAENLNVSGPLTNSFRFINSGTAGPGHGGDVTIAANTALLDWTTISTGDSVAQASLPDPSSVSGSAGHITITGDMLRLQNSILDTEAFAAFADTQAAGNTTLSVGNISMLNSKIALTGFARGGAFTMNTDMVHTDFSSVETVTVSGPGGGITVNARAMDLTNGSALISSTFGDGNAGDISVTATGYLNLIGRTGPNPLGLFAPSGLFSNSFGFFGSQGNAGNVTVTTPQLLMAGGRINTVTQSSGGGGNVTLNVPQSISIAGEFLTDPSIIPSIFDIGPLAPSGVVTQTIGSDLCVGPCGNAGTISVITGSLMLNSGAQVNSGTGSTGQGGNIVIQAADAISLSGTLSDGSSVGVLSRSIGTTPDAGSGGNISLSAAQSISLDSGAGISASSTGAGNAGNIKINAGKTFVAENSSVTTKSTNAGGGDIEIIASDLIRLINSQISASARLNGGNILIDPNAVILQNSQVTADAIVGNGGNITIITPVFLMDQTSTVSASSQFGQSGTINIQSPTSDLSGTVSSLPSSMRQSASLQTGRCAALASGEASSLIIGGRETLPTEPGGWLPSPLAFLNEGDGLVARGEGQEGLSGLSGRSGLSRLSRLSDSTDPSHQIDQMNQIDQTDLAATGAAPLLSLRRLTPAGFLTQRFAENESSGCRS